MDLAIFVHVFDGDKQIVMGKVLHEHFADKIGSLTPAEAYLLLTGETIEAAIVDALESENLASGIEPELLVASPETTPAVNVLDESEVSPFNLNLPPGVSPHTPITPVDVQDALLGRCVRVDIPNSPLQDAELEILSVMNGPDEYRARVLNGPYVGEITCIAKGCFKVLD